MNNTLDKFKKSLSVYSDIGNYRSHNEDKYVISKIDPTTNGAQVLFFGVFDGHGGELCSEYLKNNFSNRLAENIDKIEQIKTMKKIITDSCHQINQDFLENNNKAIDGSCALMGFLIQKQDNNFVLLTANVGDSQAILVRKTSDTDLDIIRLNELHKPNKPHEKNYIEKHGGHVIGGRIFGLAVSRAFGNRDIINKGLRCDPDFSVVDLDETHWFFIYASDGLWDVVGEEEAANFVFDHNFGDDIAEKLAKYALDKGSTDNVTVIAGNLASLLK